MKNHVPIMFVITICYLGTFFVSHSFLFLFTGMIAPLYIILVSNLIGLYWCVLVMDYKMEKHG